MGEEIYMQQAQDSRFNAQDGDSRLKTDVKRESYLFALEIIKYIDSLPKEYVCGTIGKQLLRSATSIGANIVEAKSSSSRRDFINFYNHSLKSANETKYWLELLRDSGKSGALKVDHLLESVISISNILARSILTMKDKRF